MMPERTQDSFPVVISEKIRLSDTDRQGHVNNVNFAFFLEAGRSDILHERHDLRDPGCHFVMATSTIDFRGELHWPGEVQIASGMERIGSSSVTFRQALFQGGRCVAESTSIIVQVNIARQKAEALSPRSRELFDALLVR